MSSICVIGESDPFVAQLLQRYAEKSGLKVKRAIFSQDFLDLAKTSTPVVVILDVELPGTIQGWEAIRVLRAESTFAYIPVISCSWLNKEKAAKLMGPLAGHMQKPDLHYEDFLIALQKAGIATDGQKQVE
jgi:DNA-binding response OmpR family regulator